LSAIAPDDLARRGSGRQADERVRVFQDVDHVVRHIRQVGDVGDPHGTNGAALGFVSAGDEEDRDHENLSLLQRANVDDIGPIVGRPCFDDLTDFVSGKLATYLELVSDGDDSVTVPVYDFVGPNVQGP
jgi:hypothetical protein